MGVKIRSQESVGISVFLDNLLNTTEEIEINFLKRSAEVVKKNVIANLNAVRTDNDDPEHKHMADDVQASVVKDKFGDRTARIRGGRRTGTKWHLVNDGTYRSRATHFIDKALQQSEPEIEQILDDELRKAGF